ncbi:early nodulin-like protein 14 [Euphorbia lathyris]|uniref:early nodulin-like protein 14 n=1 Tax=Euphorbia lathyris TaxID=212925 RepID=UPI003313A943
MASFLRFLASSMVVLALLFSLSEAKDVLIGGKSDAWKIPNSQSDSLNKWAESSRFRVGDSLVWKYDSQKDSVLQVTKEAYVTCNVSNPIKEYKDGNSKVELDRSGPFYFISGAEGHCEKGQKVIVVVLSQRNKRITGISPAQAPSPMEFEGGPAAAPAPTSSGTSLKGSLVVFLGIMLWGLF